MKNGVSARQLAVASFTGLLAPAAVVAGMDWLGAVLAVPVVLAAAWCWNALGKRGDWVARWKGWSGAFLTLLYIMWFFALGGAVLGRAGARMTVPDGNGAGWVVLLVWVPVLYLAKGKPAAFARAAEIFYLVMGTALVLTLVFGVDQIEPRWLLRGSGTVWGSFLVAAGTGCIGVTALLLWDGGEKEETFRWVPWSGAAACAAALMSVVTTGVLSPVLAVEQERPFFVMSVGLGETARIEGLVSAVWLLADVTLLGLLLQCARKLWVAAGLPWAKGAPWVCALVVLGLGVWLRDGKLAGRLLREVLPVAGLILGGAVPALACIWGKCRKGEMRDSISGGETG